jgi:hypothetical protein
MRCSRCWPKPLLKLLLKLLLVEAAVEAAACGRDCTCFKY